MGIYFNPDNGSFKSDVRSRIYVDKTGLLYDGLKEDILTMLEGGRSAVKVNTFTNDLSVIRSKDEALTALIHLGYPGYDSETEEAYIPNYEVAEAYRAALQTGEWKNIADTAIRRIKEKRYAGALKNCGFETLLVGISYGKDKKHRCRIEKADSV